MSAKEITDLHKIFKQSFGKGKSNWKNLGVFSLVLVVVIFAIGIFNKITGKQ